MQRNRMISSQTGIMLIGEKDGENSAVRTNEMEISFSFSFKSRSMSDDLANVRYMYHKYCIFPTLAIFLIK